MRHDGHIGAVGADCLEVKVGGLVIVVGKQCLEEINLAQGVARIAEISLTPVDGIHRIVLLVDVAIDEGIEVIGIGQHDVVAHLLQAWYHHVGEQLPGFGEAIGALVVSRQLIGDAQAVVTRVACQTQRPFEFRDAAVGLHRKLMAFHLPIEETGLHPPIRMLSADAVEQEDAADLRFTQLVLLVEAVEPGCNAVERRDDGFEIIVIGPYGIVRSHHRPEDEQHDRP